MNEKAFLGIDVSKGYADFLLINSSGKIIEHPFQLADNKEGKLQLKALMKQWTANGISELYCGVESTGGYENNWFRLLKQLSAQNEGQIFVSRLNPKAVKSVGEASLRRTITDAVSAHSIALYLLKFPEKIDYGNSHLELQTACKYGRQHYTYIRMLQKQKVQLSNQLEKLIYQYFSEMMVYCRHGIPVWVLNLLVKYPNARAVRKAGAKNLAMLKSVTAQKAEQILTKARQSDLVVDEQVSRFMMLTATEILHKEDLIQRERQYLRDLYADSKQAALLCTIPGIGMDSAVALLLEIEDISRFESAKKLAAFFGISPVFKQSGDGNWGAHMSKQGRGEVRAILFMAILSGLRFNPILKEIYDRFRLKGVNHKQAAGVIMHKLLRLIYGILKSGKPFMREIDMHYQQRATQKQAVANEIASRVQLIRHTSAQRFKPVFTTAPISRKNVQRRKKLLESQTDNVAKEET